jgi:hypothetical protein
MRQGLNDIDDSFFLYALGSRRSRNLPAAHAVNYGCPGRRSIGVMFGYAVPALPAALGYPGSPVD